MSSVAPHSSVGSLFPFRRLLLYLSVIILSWVLPPHVQGADPSRYQELKTQLKNLPEDKRRSQWREPWQKLADDFFELYTREQTWINRPAALFRSAVALDELARRSRTAKDGRRAEKCYLELVKKHADSVLADDALFKAAKLRAEVLKDLPGSRELLQQIRKRYPQGDMAAGAADYDAMLAAELSAQAAQEEDDSRDAKLPRLPVKTILLDPGHGGKDPGAIHNGIEEHEIALDISKRLGVILAANGYAVRYTRYSNVWTSLEDRTAKVRTDKADLFISIHVNAARKTESAGFETYYLDIKRVSRSVRLAAVENAVRNRKKETVGTLPVWTLLRMQNRDSLRLARSIHNAALAHMKSKKYTTQDGRIKTASFQVLRQAGVPAVLLETGYCSNEEEARNLRSPAYRAALAKGIAVGIMAYARKR